MLGIIGLGYVGITSMLCFSAMGIKVIGVDSNKNIVDQLQSGKLNIKDKKLADYLSSQHKTMQFTSDLEDLSGVDEVLICVPTNGSDGGLDLSIVISLLDDLERLGKKTVWIRSTIDQPEIFDSFSKSKMTINSYPEFLREGKCWTDFFDPPLVVLGCQGKRKSVVQKALENAFPKVNICTPKEALTVKLLCNAFHALKVSFANEASNLRWVDQIDLISVMKIFVQDTKLNLSPYYLKPGLPFGGPCLGKDTSAVGQAVELIPANNLFSTILEQNERHKLKYVSKVLKLGFSSIGIYGYEFKKQTGDIRNSPILDIACHLSQEVEVLLCHEPHVENFITRAEAAKFGRLQIASELGTLEERCELILSEILPTSGKIINWNDL